jgi:hypothetical protein
MSPRSIILTFQVPDLISIFLSLGRLSKESVQVRAPLWHFVTSLFYGEELLGPRPTTNLEDNPLSAVRNCLFSIFAATLHIWRACPPSAALGRAMPWWQGTHSTWITKKKIHHKTAQVLTSRFSCVHICRRMKRTVEKWMQYQPYDVQLSRKK